MAKALRVLHDLRIAGPVDFPESGVPHDTRLVFKALSLAPDISVSALIHPDFLTSKLPKMVRTAPLAAASMLLNGYGLSYGNINRRRQWYRKLWAWLKLLAFEPAAMPLGQVSPLLTDSIWRRYLARSLGAGDRHLLDQAEIVISAVSEQALNGHGSKRSRRIATEGYDFIVFPELRNARVSAGTKKVIRYHDALPLLAADLFGAGVPAHHYRLLKNCVRDCYFVCNSEPTRQNLISLFPAVEARTAVVPCALADPTYRSALGVNEIILQSLADKDRAARRRQGVRSQIQPDQSFILMVSTIEPRKNHMVAIEAFEILRSTLPEPPKLVIVGKPGFGSERVLAAMQPGIDNGSIIHLSDVPRAHLNVLFAEAAALIFPSLDEGFGYTPLEAMSNGTPVVASDIPTHRWVFSDSVLYAPPSDPRALASQIELLVASPGREHLAAELLERAQPVLARYGAERVSEQWSEALHRFQAPEALVGTQLEQPFAYKADASSTRSPSSNAGEKSARRRKPAHDAWQQSIENEIVAETHHQLSRRLRFRLPRLKVEFTDRLHEDWDCIYRRDGRGFALELPAHSAKFTCGKAGQLGPTYLYWLMQCPADVEQLGVTLSDGENPTAVRFSPSTNQPGIIPIPDPFFFGNRGFESWGYFARSQCVRWHDRSEQIVWRGSASGVGNFDPAHAVEHPEHTAHRLRFCLVARGRADLDVGLHRYLGEGITFDQLREQGIGKDAIPEKSWAGRKFAIDIDGQTNTWSNFLIRMHLGCCVFKINSPSGFRQWYYERLRPFEHFIPVRSDFSDLFDRIEWARQNDARCAEIAENAQAFARSLTFGAGRREAVDLISRHWR